MTTMPAQKTAYVTGAASGIGRQVAEMLAGRGIRVAVADMNFEGVKTVATYLNYVRLNPSAVPCLATH